MINCQAVRSVTLPEATSSLNYQPFGQCPPDEAKRRRVLATISEKRFGYFVNDSAVDHFNPEVVTAQDYYPFASANSYAC
jgi:hypothetical protein